MFLIAVTPVSTPGATAPTANVGRSPANVGRCYTPPGTVAAPSARRKCFIAASGTRSKVTSPCRSRTTTPFSDATFPSAAVIAVCAGVGLVVAA